MAKDIKSIQRKFNLLVRLHMQSKGWKRLGMIARNERRKLMMLGNDINGNSFVPLSESRIRQKQKKGSDYPTTPLMDTGVLSKPNIEVIDNGVRVTVPKKREKVSPYHNEGQGHMPVREHWGISEAAEERIYRQWVVTMRKLFRAVWMRS